MTSLIQGVNVSKCIYIFQYSLYQQHLYVRRHVPFYDWWLSWQRLHSLNDSLQTTLYCHIDTWFVTCSLWICHYELLYIYGINDVWILNLSISINRCKSNLFDCDLIWQLFFATYSLVLIIGLNSGHAWWFMIYSNQFSFVHIFSKFSFYILMSMLLKEYSK